MRRHGLFGLIMAGTLGCGSTGSAAMGPRSVLQAYGIALKQGRIDAAYRLLSDEAKRSLSREAFARVVAENPDDVKEIARALTRPSSDPVVRAKVLAPSGDTLVLIYQDGHWRIDGSGIDRYGQTTPRQALNGFLRAYDRGRYDVLMRYVPEREKRGQPEALWGESSKTIAEGLSQERLKTAWTGEQKNHIAGIVQAIKSALPTARIEETADRAVMPYGGGGTVLFLRENGDWKIEDLK